METQIEVAKNLGYLSAASFGAITDRTREIGRMLGSLIAKEEGGSGSEDRPPKKGTTMKHLLSPCGIFPGCLAVLLTCCLAATAAHADTGCGESGLLTIENGSCAQSGVFAIDNRYASGDLNQNGYVDQADFAMFDSCRSGPAVPHNGSETCQRADLDGDGDMDQSDFGIFQRCYSGEGNLADPNCAN
jgi:hypothetical protein